MGWKCDPLGLERPRKVVVPVSQPTVKFISLSHLQRRRCRTGCAKPMNADIIYDCEDSYLGPEHMGKVCRELIRVQRVPKPYLTIPLEINGWIGQWDVWWRLEQRRPKCDIGKNADGPQRK